MKLIYCLCVLLALLCISNILHIVKAQTVSSTGLCIAEYQPPFVALQTFSQSLLKMPKFKTLPKNKADYQLFSLDNISVQIRIRGGYKKSFISACAVKFGDNVLYFSRKEAKFNGQDIPSKNVNNWFEEKRKITHDGVVRLFASGFRIHPHGSAEGSVIELRRVYDAKSKKAVAIAVYITMPHNFNGKLSGLCGSFAGVQSDPDSLSPFVTIETAKKYFVSQTSSNSVFYMHQIGATEIAASPEPEEPSTPFEETKSDDQIMDDIFLSDSKIDWEGITKSNGTYFAVAGILHRLSKNILKHRQDVLDQISKLHNGVFEADYYLTTTNSDVPIIAEAVSKTENEIKIETDKLKILEEGLKKQKALAKKDFLAIEEELFVLRTLMSYIAVKHEEQVQKSAKK